MIAHIGPLPVEELLPTVASALLAARIWLQARR